MKKPNWSPEGELHKKTLNVINDMVSVSRSRSSAARRKMRDVELMVSSNAYYESEDDKDAKRLDPRNPVNIVIPRSFACLAMTTAYLAREFLGASPNIYELEGEKTVNSKVSAALCEIVLERQRRWFKHGLAHITAFRDMSLYGVAAMGINWAKHKRSVPVVTQMTEIISALLKSEGISIDSNMLVRHLEERVVREGNQLINVDPQDLVLDPSSAINRYQEAEYFGYFDAANAIHLLRAESDPEERLFNCAHVRRLAKHGTSAPVEGWDSVNKRARSNLRASDIERNAGTLLYLYWWLIPSEYGLGDRDRPQLWFFKVWNGEVIVWAEPLDLDHGFFPVVLGGFNTSGYDLWPESDIMLTSGIQKVIDFLARSHIDSKRKVQEGITIYDPTFIDSDLLMEPGGKTIPLSRPLFGQGGIDDVFRSVVVADGTGMNIQEMRVFIQTMDALLNNKPVLDNAPDRPTVVGLQMAREVDDSPNQLKAEIINDQYWGDLTDILVKQTQQFMDTEMTVNIVGSRNEQYLRQALSMNAGVNDVVIDPWSLGGDFHPRPINRRMGRPNLQVMNSLLERFLSIPEISIACAQQLNIPGMLLHFAVEAGFHDIMSWVRAGGGNIQASVLPDEAITEGKYMPIANQQQVGV